MEQHGVTPRHDRLIAAIGGRFRNLGVTRRADWTAACPSQRGLEIGGFRRVGDGMEQIGRSCGSVAIALHFGGNPSIIDVIGGRYRLRCGVLHHVFQVAQGLDGLVEVGHRRRRHQLAGDIDDLAEPWHAEQGCRNLEGRELADADHEQGATDDQAEDAALMVIDVELAIAGEDIAPAHLVAAGVPADADPALLDPPGPVVELEPALLLVGAARMFS
jgi:hypothetical protein